MYNIYIRDSNLKRIGEITDFKKLDLIPRFNGVGSFVLDIPTDSHAAKELIKPKHGIIVKKDGRTIFSGNVTSPRRSFNNTGDTMTFAGKDDNSYLLGRIVYPEPYGNFLMSAYDVRSGKAETIMKQYVDVNAGPNALSERRILEIETDKGQGGSITGRARFNNLLDFLASLALAGGGLGFRVVQEDDELQFQVYQPSDKTRSAFFSPLLGNLAGFEYTKVSPEANYVFVGGGGQGTERIIKQKGNSASITQYGRFETFRDRRDTEEIDELNQTLDEELVNMGEQNNFSFTPIDTPQLAFGRDYSLGDKVSIVLTQPNEVIDVETLYYFISAYQTIPVLTERLRMIQEKLDVIQDIVCEVKITISPEGESISPVVGNQDSNSNAILGIFDKMRKITKRISSLERR